VALLKIKKWWALQKNNCLVGILRWYCYKGNRLKWSYIKKEVKKLPAFNEIPKYSITGASILMTISFLLWYISYRSRWANKHEMVSNRGSCLHELRKVQARPVLRCPECSCHLQRWAADFVSADGGEIMLSPQGYAESNLKVPQWRILLETEEMERVNPTSEQPKLW